MSKAYFHKKNCLLLISLLILGLAFPGFSMMIGNTTGRGFDEPITGSGALSKASGTYETVEGLVIQGATYFLKGKASVYSLSSQLEASDLEGIFYSDYQLSVDEALSYFRIAQSYYKALKNKADNTPYNQEVIDKLRAFDYDSFSKNYGLNIDIFNQVKSFLEAGDIRGVYARFLEYTENIIGILEVVQTDLYKWNFPKVETIWNLNQECANMLLFGQYVARVFYKIP